MLCEKCKKNYATVHYRYNENGNITEIHLCPDCAKSEGLLHENGTVSSGFLSDNGLFGDAFGKLPFFSYLNPGYGGKAKSINLRVCPGCGLTESELRNNGKLGCEKCYSTFSDIVNLMLNKMHMSTEYKGKIPERSGKELSIMRQIEKLKEDMHRAVENQEYEEAAKIRDLIKNLENDGGENNENNGGDEQ